MSTLSARPDDYVDFIDMAYAVPEEPHRFDDLVEIGQRFVAHLPGDQAPRPGTDVRLGMDARFAPHAQRLSRAIEREEALSAAARAETFHAQITIHRPDLTVRGNAAAERLTGRAFPCALEDLPLDRRSIEVLSRNALGESARTSERRDQIILATIEEPQVRSCLALVQRPPDSGTALSVSISYIDWSPELVSRLGEAFGLSESETDILDGYLNNLTARQIAELRGRSPETVKVQSKAILRKTGCPKMHDVMQLSASIAYLLRLHEPAPDAAPAELWAAPRREMRLLKRPGGREAAFYVNGDGRRAVLFMHGLIQGPFFTRRFLAALAGRDLQVISPSRPGFGFTSPASSRSAYNDTVTADTLAILDSLGIDKALVVSTKIGASHACRVARALGPRASGLVLVAAGAPVFTDENLAQMDAQTRMAAVAARYAPSMMKLMMGLGIATYRRRGVKAFLENYFAASPRDRAHMADPELLRIFKDGVYHVVQQGPDGWVRDSASSMAGWEPDHAALALPQLWIHGREDRVMRPEPIADYLVGKPGCELEVIEDAGMNLIHEHPELVVDRLGRMAG